MLTEKKKIKVTTLTLLDEKCLASSLTDGVTCTSSDGCSAEFWSLLPPFRLSVQEQTRTSWCRRSRTKSLPVSSSSFSCTTRFDTFVWYTHNTRTHTHTEYVFPHHYELFFLNLPRTNWIRIFDEEGRTPWTLSTGEVGKDFGKQIIPAMNDSKGNTFARDSIG